MLKKIIFCFSISSNRWCKRLPLVDALRPTTAFTAPPQGVGASVPNAAGPALWRLPCHAARSVRFELSDVGSLDGGRRFTAGIRVCANTPGYRWTARERSLPCCQLDTPPRHRCGFGSRRHASNSSFLRQRLPNSSVDGDDTGRPQCANDSSVLTWTYCRCKQSVVKLQSPTVLVVRRAFYAVAEDGYGARH